MPVPPVPVTTATSAAGNPARPHWRERPYTGPAIMRDVLAVPAIALTAAIMAYAGRFGLYPILIFYLLWLPRGMSAKFAQRCLKANPLPTLYMGLCVASTAWSLYRVITLRTALETASMVFCSLIVAYTTRLETFIKGLTGGIACVLAASLIDGTYGVDNLTGDYSLIGLFASKNQVGLFAELGTFFSLALLLSRQGLVTKLCFGLAPLGVSLVSLYLSRSATSVASLAIALAVVGAALFIVRMPRRIRPAILAAACMLGVGLLLAGFAFNAEKIGFSLLGKDTTLTGRTFLWSEGLRIGAENPVLGRGFAGFWVPGEPKAEEFWFKFGVLARSGFHFHNSYIQAFVDLGAVGTLLIAFLFLSALRQSARYIWRHGFDLTGAYGFGVVVIFLIRSFVEMDVMMGTFAIGPLLFFGVVPRLNGPLAGTPAMAKPA